MTTIRSTSSKTAIPTAIEGAEAVEIKVTIRPDQELKALRALKLDEDSAEVRVIYFYDTTKLTLFSAGVVLRARLVMGDADDTTVKMRPVIPADLSEEWEKVAGFKVEADRTGERIVCSASLTEKRKRSEIDAAAEGRRPIGKLFSKDQQRLLTESCPKAIDFETLKVMGPIRVLCWTTEHKGFRYKLTSEEWRLPDGDDLLEVSVKVKSVDATKAQSEFEEHLRGMGLDPHGAQETKTRTALQYFARSRKPSKDAQ